MTLPRTLSAVPAVRQVRVEIADAVAGLAAREEERWIQRRRAELAAIRRECEFLADVLCEFLRELRKAGFNPDEPRVPAGNPDGGQWTTGDNGAASTTSESSGPVLSDAASDSNWIPGAQYAANDRSSNGGNQGVPLGRPPAVPAEQPASNQARAGEFGSCSDAQTLVDHRMVYDKER